MKGFRLVNCIYGTFIDYVLKVYYNCFFQIPFIVSVLKMIVLSHETLLCAASIFDKVFLFLFSLLSRAGEARQ